jgi:hypothetical protein
MADSPAADPPYESGSSKLDRVDSFRGQLNAIPFSTLRWMLDERLAPELSNTPQAELPIMMGVQNLHGGAS